MVVHWPSWRGLLLPLYKIHKHTQTSSENMSDLYMEMVWFGIGGCWGGRGTAVALGVRDVLSHICTYHLRWIIVHKWKLGPLARLPVQCWLRALSVFLSPSLSLSLTHTHTLYSCSLSPLGHSPLSSCCKFHWKLETQTCPCPKRTNIFLVVLFLNVIL